jgi:MFS family permease
MSSSPRNIKDFYQYAIHVIYAIILTTSFDIAAKVSIPIEAISPIYDWAKFVNAITLLLVYITIISGWLGYTKSIIKRPHEGMKGNMRFVIEVIITFFLAYFINLTNPDKENFRDHFDSVFVWVLPVIFLLFIIWDLLKYYEYLNHPDEDKRANKNRIWITGFASLGIFVQSMVYLYEIVNGNVNRNSPYTIFLYFSISSIIIILIYRMVKWEDKPRSIREFEA